LNALFRGRLIKKTYVAISEGYPERDEATLEHWLAKDRDDNRALMAKPGDADAKKCLLSYRVLERRSQVTMIEVWPETGRSHQIRAQLAAVGCPLVGDVKYGARSAWDGKVALHAACLEFSHPVGGTPMLLRARVPGYWESIWPAELPDHVSILFDRSH
jgi:23S rRNA pseudouridine1911/1915/1917 synthase